MSSQRGYYRKKRSAKEKKRLLYGIFLALIFVVSVIVAVYFIVIVGVG